MVTPQEKAQCVSWLIETKSDVQTQQRYMTKNGKDPPSRSSIRRWHKNFMKTVSVLDAVRNGRPRTSAENIDRVTQAFSCSPIKSIRTAARELKLPPTTVHKVLHKRLRLYAYKMQMLQRLKPNDKTKRIEFADNMLQRISEDEEFIKRICFNDEATFHVSCKLNKHNVSIWGSEHPMRLGSLKGIVQNECVVWTHVQSSNWSIFLPGDNNYCRLLLGPSN